MSYTQKCLLDFYDIPCAMIVGIDGKEQLPPIRLTKDDLDNLFWKNRDEWERIAIHFLDGRGMPHPDGPLEFDRSDLFGGNHFQL